MEFQTTLTCCFCQGLSDPELGKFFQNEEEQLACHQFCMFFASGLPQKGDDTEGFDGFLFQDIRKEVKRVARIPCSVCNQLGASAGCALRRCKSIYHYKCGLDAGFQFCFMGRFETFCIVHRQQQDLSQLDSEIFNCPVCLDEINASDKRHVIKSPCCKNLFAHKQCIQTQAYASGYFFKCPTCNNEKLYKKEMSSYGVFIPRQDAAWEKEENAFNELLEEYEKCDRPDCKCPYGSTHNGKGHWHLLRCGHCGQSAVHSRCLGRRKAGYGFICSDCNDVVCLGKSPGRIKSKEATDKARKQKELLQAWRKRNIELGIDPFADLKKRHNVKECIVALESFTDKDIPLIVSRYLKDSQETSSFASLSETAGQWGSLEFESEDIDFENDYPSSPVIPYIESESITLREKYDRSPLKEKNNNEVKSEGSCFCFKKVNLQQLNSKTTGKQKARAKLSLNRGNKSNTYVQQMINFPPLNQNVTSS